MSSEKRGLSWRGGLRGDLRGGDKVDGEGERRAEVKKGFEVGEDS